MNVSLLVFATSLAKPEASCCLLVTCANVGYSHALLFLGYFLGVRQK